MTAVATLLRSTQSYVTAPSAGRVALPDTCALAGRKAPHSVRPLKSFYLASPPLQVTSETTRWLLGYVAVTWLHPIAGTPLGSACKSPPDKRPAHRGNVVTSDYQSVGRQFKSVTPHQVFKGFAAMQALFHLSRRDRNVTYAHRC